MQNHEKRLINQREVSYSLRSVNAERQRAVAIFLALLWLCARASLIQAQEENDFSEEFLSTLVTTSRIQLFVDIGAKDRYYGHGGLIFNETTGQIELCTVEHIIDPPVYYGEKPRRVVFYFPDNDPDSWEIPLQTQDFETNSAIPPLNRDRSLYPDLPTCYVIEDINALDWILREHEKVDTSLLPQLIDVTLEIGQTISVFGRDQALHEYHIVYFKNGEMVVSSDNPVDMAAIGPGDSGSIALIKNPEGAGFIAVGVFSLIYEREEVRPDGKGGKIITPVQPLFGFQLFEGVRSESK